jgi:hypothetical protein
MRHFFANSVPIFFSERNNELSNSLSTSFNFLELQNFQELFQGPGIYAIYCNKTNKIYFGESSNVLSRLGRHHHHLKTGSSDCSSLQKDLNTYGETSFSFFILSVGPQWSDLQKRRKKEDELIAANKGKVYNSETYNEMAVYRKLVKVKDQIFESIAEASRQTGVPKTTIIRNCKNVNNLDWNFVETSQTDQYIINMNCANPVSVDGRFYRSERLASKETGIHRRSLTRYLDSPKYPNIFRITQEEYWAWANSADETAEE